MNLETLDISETENIFVKRARARIGLVYKKLIELNITSFYLCGGGLLTKFDDLDLYPTESTKEIFSACQRKGFSAFSFKENETKVQLCSYYKDSLSQLVDSFDFSHCQIGIQVKINAKKDLEPGDHLIEVSQVYFSDAFVRDMINQTTSYTGSEFPLSSLCRVYKVSEKIGLSRGKRECLILQVLANVLRRGFRGYDDLLSQLQSVDITIAKDEDGVHYDKEIMDSISEIFTALNKEPK